MTKKILTLPLVIVAIMLGFMSCQKTEYAFGDIVSPSALTLTTAIAGVDATNPNGNGTGLVTITAAAQNAITYKVDFGDGKTQVIPSGTIQYKYSIPGTNSFTVIVNAIGTGGVVTTLSKKITVFVAFEIPAAILANITGGSSKIWVTDKLAGGHLGVGPNDAFEPIWWQAGPLEKDFVGCLYDDEITFSKDALNNVSINVNNKGQSFVQGASVGSYGLSGGEACYDIVTTGSKKLIFSDATSKSTTANSTRIQFVVPGNGIINFATGSNTYEILSITATNMWLRNIGADGNAWYQKLKVK